MVSWLDPIIQGILLGGLYALFAAGLSLIFGVMRLVNIAHGDLIVLSSYVALTTCVMLGLPPLAAALLVVPVMAVAGYGLQRLLLNRTMGGEILPPLLVTFGLSVIIQNTLLTLYSADPQKLRARAIETASVNAGPVSVGVLPLIVFITAVAVIGALQWMFYHTALGRAFRATSDRQDIVQLMGLNRAHIFGLAMAVALAVTALAGVFLGIRTSFDPAAGGTRLIFGFEAVIIGGLGNIWGTLAGGVILGLAQTLGARVDPGFQILTGHLAFLIILAIRPRGLFPRID
ncbi:branched-chain amino acid ABC transporter permease [Rhizobium paknamense]|uniref:Branched-chain amino acid transport system permease protein n=1 Tax=Rhizobium paknamense TaxID=1206817 RepID=A0ABU0IH43_9HYPH|nr:branched-chain amino acid ABC transporter permease [Rhizobium paknamense]MDQ0457578.1 branched-chain amino acid transport system permease protein [Rhizobium paknamense]